MNDSPANLPASADSTATRRLYLPTVFAAFFLLIVISITIWAGNTLTMITAMARFERTHTVSRVEAVAAFLDYQDDKKPENLETFHQKMATTQSYNKVFSRLLEIRKDTTDAEFVRILESTFSETDHPTAVIIVNRIKVLYWHPILKELVADAIGAHAAGETLKLQVTQFLATNDVLEKKAILSGIHKTRKQFIVYETSFSKSCSDLSNQISSYVTYLAIALLIISVGFISLLTYQIAKNILRRMTKDTLALRMTRFSIENASDAMYWMTPEARIVDVNDAACRLLGYARPDLLELSVPDVDAHYDAAKWPRHFEELRQRGSMTFESEQRHRDGRLIPVEVVANYVKFGDEERNCAFVRDITARKQAEEALQLSEQKFRALFEHLSEGVALHELVMDDAGAAVDYRLMAVNPAYETHTGLAAATAPGLLGTQLYGTEVPPYLLEFSRVALGGAPYAFDTFFPPLEKHFRISVISPRPGQFATVFEDITERKCREQELLQKNEEMERFTYMISHDLKSPLVTVRTFLGYLEQDLEQGKAERVAKDMGFIRDATGKMGRLLEDLLEVSRVGRVENPSVRVSLGDLIQEALNAVAGAIATRGVAIQVEVPAVTLYGDRPRLEEIWQNLVENAVKYMGGQAAPRIELGVEEAGTDLVFFVRDNGLGIDPRFQDKVFGLFEQLDPASEGTGLGLALVKRIVELYQGRIWVESEGLGRGTCFRFTLPQALKNRKQGA